MNVLPPNAHNSSAEIPSNSSSSQSQWDTLLREEQHFSKAPEAFFVAWKRGVSLAGPHLFGIGPEADITSAQNKWDLCPKVTLIRKAIGPMSPSERLFLAALVSFYNAEDGGQLFKRAGFHGLAGLILNYSCW